MKGAVRNSGIARGVRQGNAPYKASTGNNGVIFGLANGSGLRGPGGSGVPQEVASQGDGILSRLGGPVGQGGTKVLLSNLAAGVSEKDVIDLCGQTGGEV